MGRRSLLILNCLLFATAIIAGWFAANAPQLARPALTEFGDVTLPDETPPLPPAPILERAGDSAPMLARRPLFTLQEGVSLSAAAAPPRRADPLARTVLTPAIAPPPDDGAMAGETFDAGVDFQVALALARPRHEQYFGGHLLPPETFLSDQEKPPERTAPDGATSDGATSDDAADGETEISLAPATAPKPRPSPLRGRASPDAATAGAGQADAPAIATADAPRELGGATMENESASVAAAAAGVASGAASADSDDGVDMILLGVFQSRGAERALVRTATDGNVRVRPGDEIMGWRVASIGEDHIQLRRATQTRMLRLPRGP